MTEPTSQASSRPRRPLGRGWVKRKLIIDLAKGEKTQRVLAKEYGVSQPSISEFKIKHAAEISEAAKNLEDEFVGLWVANKANRLAEYEADIERVNEQGASDLASKHRALRHVAEELGHIPNKVTLAGEVSTRVTYEVVGVPPEDLQ